MKKSQNLPTSEWLDALEARISRVESIFVKLKRDRESTHALEPRE